MLVVGRLQIAEDGWLELVGGQPAPWSLDGWLGGQRPADTLRPDSRGELLKSLRALALCECRVTTGGGVVRLDVSGYLRGTDFTDYGAGLAEVFVAAYSLGGTGTLWFLEEQTLWGPQAPELCYVLRCDDGQARLEHPSEKRQARVLATATFTALRDRVERRLPR